MDWTSWPEDEPRCPGEHGAVCFQEQIARLLHSGLGANPGPFRRSDLFAGADKKVSNECGNSHGLSVVRNATLDDSELRRRSQQQAAARPNRTALGALVAEVAALRKIKLPGRPAEQVVFVYDDPLPSDSLHAIVRGVLMPDRSDQDRIRHLIQDAFCRIVEP